MILRGRNTIADVPEPDAAEERCGVMNPVCLQSQSPASERYESDPRVTHQLGPLVLIDDPVWPASVTECTVGQGGWSDTVVRDLFDAVISHLYRAGMVIHTRFQEVRSVLGDDLDQVTDELDAAIHRLQVAAHENDLCRPGDSTARS